MIHKTLKKQVLASLSTTVLLGFLAAGTVGAQEEPVISSTPNATVNVDTSSTTTSEEKSETVVGNTATSTDKDMTTVTEEKESSTAQTITLQALTLFQTTDQQITEQVDLQGHQWEEFTWTFGNEQHLPKPISEWKTWNQKEGFTGEPFIAVEGTDSSITITFKALFGEKVDLRWPENARRTYRDYMGDFELKGVSKDGKVTITKKITVKPYESFKTHEEMLKQVEETKEAAASDRQVTVETIGTSAQNRKIEMGIVAENQEAIDEYLNHTTPEMLHNPDQMLKDLEEGKLDYHIPILVNNTHADEQPAIDIITDLFKTFATKETVTFKTLVGEGNSKENKTEKEVTLNLPDLLKKFIFLFDFTENPDGDVLNTRALANGMDPNRDTGYQTNPETKAIAAQINKWNPLSLLDIHGFVNEYLIEPATPPHDPNFEYDLFRDAMLENAHAMGNAGIANSTYKSFLVPMEEFLKGEDGNPNYRLGWDDSSSGYTGVYGLYHGILGHTMEIPATNQDSYNAGFHAILGSIHYLDENRNRLFGNKLKFFSRGIHKVESDAAEKELVGPENEVVGRQKHGHETFFPDYYVLPLTISSTNDVDQAFAMVEYFKRNNVEVKELTQDTGDFKKGDLVIDMAQAKRGYANHILYRGSDESAWSAMYAELIANFPDMRGFKAVPVYHADAFKGMLSTVTQTAAPRLQVDQTAPYYFVANNSLSTIQAINRLLHQGHSVYTAEDGYIVSTSDFEMLLKDYSLYGKPLQQKPEGSPLTVLKVYAPGNPNEFLGYPSPSEVTNALKQMGFDVVNTMEESDVVILDNDQFDETVLGKKPTLVMGSDALQKLEDLKVVTGFDVEHTNPEHGGDYEGILNVTVDDANPLASGYLKDSIFYSRTGSWIQGVPEGFNKIVTVKEKDFYVAGWWPNHEKVARKVLAIDGNYRNQPLFIFAGNPTNKLHTLHFYRWVSNLLWNKEHAKLVDIYTPSVPSHSNTGNATTSTTVTEEVSQTAHWVYDTNQNTWMFEKADGTKSHNEWVNTNGRWYYLGTDGVMATNKWVGDYYVHADGSMAESEWIYDASTHSWYYVMATGKYARQQWLRLDAKWYAFKENGVMAHNEWVDVYYLHADGSMAESEWIYDDTYHSWFYIKGDGTYAQNEWIQLNGKWYYLKSGGYLAVNETINGYYVNNDGEWIA